MVALVRHRLGRGLFPPQLAGVAIEAEYLEPIEVGRRAGLCLETRILCRQLVRLCFTVGLHRRDDEYLVVPYDRSGTSEARQFDLPLDVGDRVPLDRGIRV